MQLLGARLIELVQKERGHAEADGRWVSFLSRIRRLRNVSCSWTTTPTRRPLGRCPSLRSATTSRWPTTPSRRSRKRNVSRPRSRFSTSVSGHGWIRACRAAPRATRSGRLSLHCPHWLRAGARSQPQPGARLCGPLVKPVAVEELMAAIARLAAYGVPAHLLLPVGSRKAAESPIATLERRHMTPAVRCRGSQQLTKLINAP